MMVDSKDATTDPSPSTKAEEGTGTVSNTDTPASGATSSSPNGQTSGRAGQTVLVRKQSSATGWMGMMLGLVALVAALGYPIWTPFLYGTTGAPGPIPGDRGEWLTAQRVNTLLETEIASLTRRLDELARQQTGLQNTLDMARLPAILMISSRLQQLLVTDQPYDRDLRLFRMVAGDDDRASAIVKALNDRAADGVPTRDALAHTFGSVVYAIVLAEQRPEPFYSGAAALQMEQTVAGIAATIARLRWHLQGIPNGSDNASIAIRAERMVSRGDLQNAVAELDDLTPDAKKLADGWIADVKARLAVEQASRELEAFVIGLAARMT